MGLPSEEGYCNISDGFGIKTANTHLNAFKSYLVDRVDDTV